MPVSSLLHEEGFQADSRLQEAGEICPVTPEQEQRDDRTPKSQRGCIPRARRKLTLPTIE